MRRAAVVVAILSSSIACGGFLGFGDDDEDTSPLPAGDGGTTDVVTAEGGSDPDTPGSCVTRRLVLGTDAGIAGPDWSKGTLNGSATLDVENGALVARSGASGAPKAEATLFTSRIGNVSRIHCEVRASSSSFADDGRLLQFRIEGPQWVDFYDTRVDWQDGQLRLVYQAIPVDGTGEKSSYNPLSPPPEAGTVHDLTANLDFEGTPRVSMNIAGATLETVPPPAGPVTRAQVVIGTLAGGTFEPHEVRYESVVCEMCLAR